VLAPKDARIDTDVIEALLAMGSLGSAFRRDVGAFPGAPYLRPGAEVRQRWAERLGPKTRRLRIGISWRGGVAATRTHARSLSLQQLAPVLDLADCEFVNLQYGEVADEVAAFNAGRQNPIRVFPRAEIDDFEELAGLVANLDLVVSVQTTLVHLCGAIGQTCLTLVPHTPEWRYGAQGSTMPWYRSVRLFRQPQHGAWGPAIAEAAAALKAASGEAGSS
jgi:ADP-heptose:LPS heptosyltransferase